MLTWSFIHTYATDGRTDEINETGTDIRYVAQQSFYPAACIACATRSSYEKLCVRLSVCLSVRVSNAWFVTKRKKVVPIFLYHMKDHLSQFCDQKNGLGVTSCTTNFGSNLPRWRENADFQSILVRSASAVTRTEKSSINTNRNSTTRFPMSLRSTSYVAQKNPKTAQKRKIAPCLKKVCYKVSLSENCQRQL